MSSERSTRSSVVAFRQSRPPMPEVTVAVARRRSAPEPVTCEPGVDLSGRPKIVFLIGPGRSGKTTLARWMIERGQSAGRQAVLAALDPVNRTLCSYFDGVEQPDTPNPVLSARFLRELIGAVMEGGHSAVVDLGGGDTTLSAVLEEIPDLPGMLEKAGSAAVALYLLTPRPDDTAALLSLGFLPEATAFVCNRVYGDNFEPLLRQPEPRDAISRGARVVYMPPCAPDAMEFVELSRMSFGTAVLGAGGIGPMRAVLIQSWLTVMDRALAGISSWLP